MLKSPLQTAETVKPPVKRVQLDYLDGLRGLAALFVVLCHTCKFYQSDVGYCHWVSSSATKIIAFADTVALTHGHYGVDLFIVLSGYCLMLPVARSADRKMVGGVLNYIKRRARRILPPYYAALALVIPLIAFVPGMNTPAYSFWDLSVPALTPGIIVSHLLLVHNHSGAWLSRIDSPMWSIAVEWQIYFMFPLILLPVWRRFGMTAATVLVFALGISSYYTRSNIVGAWPWMGGLFALGAIGALISAGEGFPEHRWCDRFPWGKITLGLSLAVVVWSFLQRDRWQHLRAIHFLRQETWGSEWPMDIVVGLTVMCLLISLYKSTIASKSVPRPLLLKLLSMPKVVGLGLFSYSLYLIHAPTLELLDLLSRHWKLNGTAAALLLFGVGVPLAVGVAYLFHLAFERPFMTSHMRQAVKSLDTLHIGTAA